MLTKQSSTLLFLLLWFIPLKGDGQPSPFFIQLNQHTYKIELATTPEAYKKGLMGRKKLDQDKGMLFIFEKPQIVPIWMKNTLIPLDIIWINEKGHINYIHENAMPHDETPIIPPHKALYVLELNTGQAKESQATINNRVRVFKEKSAQTPSAYSPQTK